MYIFQMSADERESDGNQARVSYLPSQQQYLPLGISREAVANARPPGFPGAMPQQALPGNAAQHVIRPPIRAPLASAGLNRPPLVAAGVPFQQGVNPNGNGGNKDTITVKELMINVIDKALSTPYQAQVQAAGGGGNPAAGHASQPPPSPTIQNLLDSSSKPPNKTNYVRDKMGLNPRVGSMAPPAAPPPSNAASSAASQQNDCETLDLSMPRRRESANTPPTNYSQQQARGDPMLHRRSPSFASNSADARPPPAHANKVKTEPYLREISPSYDGRTLTVTPPHLLGTPSGSSSGARPPSNIARSSQPPPPQSYLSRSSLPPTTLAAAGRQPALSPKMASKPPLTIQTGSITQGTPAIQQRYGEPLLKLTPTESRAAGGGSITQGTPCFDKNIRRDSAYYPAQGRSQGSAGAFPDQHLSSRQVIMNDYAMARSTEMQRRPDSREAHHSRSISPGRRSDLSPRPRTIDPRTAAGAQLLSRDGRPVSTDPRYDPRYLAAVQAEQSRMSGLPEARGDPKADLPGHKDPRAVGLQRAQPAATLSRNYFNTTIASQLQSQQVYLTSDGRYASRSRSPPRSTPPPSRPSMTMPRQGGITSGKPIVTKELYRTAPEVTISKTSSPRGLPYNEVTNNALASLVDVAVQQPKLDLTQIRTQQQAAALMAMANNSKAASSLVSVNNTIFFSVRLFIKTAFLQTSAAAAVAASQLAQQVQASKQYYLVNDHAAAVAAASGFSSAARITAASSKPPSSTSSLSRPDAPAVIISERDRNTQQQQLALAAAKLTGNTPQNVIDAIITQSIQGVPDGLKLAAQQEELVKAMTVKAQLEKFEAAVAAHQQAAAAAANSSSRPPSSSSSADHPQKPNIPADMMLNRELSITPASSGTEEFLKKRQIMITTSATLTPTSSASAPTRAGADERQIIRVAQPVSPAKPAASLPPPPAAPEHSADNGDQPPPGMSPLDYVKNKIVEEMKKHGEDGNPLPSSSPTPAAVPGQKRSAEEAPANVEDKKKAKTDDLGPSEPPAPVAPAAPAVLPESPGSPGDMVIDESDRTETTPKAASPATASAAPTGSAGESSSPVAAPPVTTSAAAASAAANSSKYEPLSDDEWPHSRRSHQPPRLPFYMRNGLE